MSLPLDPMPTTPLVLPFSCMVSDNQRLTITGASNRRGREYCLSKPYAASKKEIAQRAALFWTRALLDGWVRLEVRFWFPDKRKRDPGNYRKALTDALSKIVYADDRQISDERYILAGYDRANPRVEILFFDGDAPTDVAA